MEATTAPAAPTSQSSRYEQLAASFADAIESIVSADAMESSVHAFKLRMIDAARQISEKMELVRTAEPHSWSPESVARRTLVSELAMALRLPERSAQNLVGRSQTLVDDLPETLGALSEGTITPRHVEKLVDQAYTLPREARGSFEQAVLPAAKTRTVAQFADRARKVRERIHPESIAERTKKSAFERNVTVEPAEDGMAWLTAFLPAQEALAIHDRLTEIALHQRAHEGEDRNLAQLRADTLSDLLIDGDVLPTADQTRGIRATVNVTVPVLTLLGKAEIPGNLDGYGPISPDVARELAANAPSFTRILTHPETGVVLSVGRDVYRPPADLQKWVRMRDGTCRCTGCRIPARKAEIDHTEPWADGGETAADNLAALCPKDHALKTHTGWKVRQIGEGKLEWTAPWSGRTYITEPEIELPA